MLLLAICFAVLQALQPFIHAHLDSHSQTQHQGIHVGMEHEELLSSYAASTVAANTDTINAHVHGSSEHAVPHAKHTISVDPGIKHDIDIANLMSSIPFVLFFIGLTLVYTFVPKRFPQFALSHTKRLRSQPQSVRAPPLF